MWSRHCYPSGAFEFIPGFKWGLCCSIFSFVDRYLYFLFFLLAIVFSVVLPFTAFVVLGYNSTYFSNKIKIGKHATPRNK